MLSALEAEIGKLNLKPFDKMLLIVTSQLFYYEKDRKMH